MSEAIASLTWLEECFAENPHFSEINWINDCRAHALKQFNQRGFPTRREELWKYTDTSHLARNKYSFSRALPKKVEALEHATIVFVNGLFSPTLSDLTILPKEITVLPLSQALETHAAVIKPYLVREYDEKRFPFALLNTALMSDGVFLQVAKNCAVTTKIHCIFINTEQNNFILCPRNIILAEENSCVTFIEEYVGQHAEHYFVSPVTMIETNQGAYVDYYKIQNEASSATHIGNVFVEQQQDSRIKTHFFSRGAQLEREDLNVWQRAKGAEAQLNGFYALHTDNQHIDHHVHIDHLAAHGTSSMIYKGTLAKKSRAVFNGKVFVHKNAQQINAHQENHNLLLSNTAEVNTKPELEIYADDIKCTHGATIGQLDQESLFYLRSRGIDEDTARKILVHGFSDQVFNQIEKREIREYIQRRVTSHEE